MSDLYLRISTRDGDREFQFEIDFDDYPMFDVQVEEDVDALEAGITEFLEAHYAQ